MVNVNEIPVEDASLAIIEGMLPNSKGEFGGALTGDKYKHLQYWRKCAGCQIHTQELGWITLGPAMGPHTAVEYYEFQRSKHAEPLEKYGIFLAGESKSQKYNVIFPNERFLPLIEQNGFREIPIDQMIAYNWHRNKALVKVVPELANVVEYKCEYGCPPNKYWTTEASRQQHIRIWHSDVAQPQAVGKEISKAIDSINQSNQMTPELAALIAKAIKDALKE